MSRVLIIVTLILALVVGLAGCIAQPVTVTHTATLIQPPETVTKTTEIILPTTALQTVTVTKTVEILPTTVIPPAITVTLPTPTITPTSQVNTIRRTFQVPMTGICIEYFDIHAGDIVVGKFEVDGQYTVNLWVEYAEKLPGGGTVYSPSNCVLETEEALEKTFSFIAPVSSEYGFFFGGFYADKIEGDKPYRGLSQTVTLELTIFPY